MAGMTPGPWEAFRDVTLNVHGVKGEGGRTVFQVGWSEDAVCPSKADSRLMIAAPELLAACEWLDRFWLQAMPGGPDANPQDGIRFTEETIGLWNAARAAIAKAKGGAS